MRMTLLQLFKSLNGGENRADAEAEFDEILASVQQTGNKGKLTIVFEFEPVCSDEGTMVVNAKIKVNPKKAARSRASNSFRMKHGMLSCQPQENAGADRVAAAALEICALGFPGHGRPPTVS